MLPKGPPPQGTPCRSAVQRIENDALKTALLSSVSHELRTPLTAIKAMVSSLRGPQGTMKREVRAEFLEGIDQDIDFLNRLVDNLLDMSKIEAGTPEPRREWHLLEDLVEGALRREGKALQSRPLEVELPEDLPSVYVNGVEVQQVLINLLDNARFPGTRTLAIPSHSGSSIGPS